MLVHVVFILCLTDAYTIYQCDTKSSTRLIQIWGGWVKLKLDFFILAIVNGRTSHETPKYSNMALCGELR